MNTKRIFLATVLLLAGCAFIAAHSPVAHAKSQEERIQALEEQNTEILKLLQEIKTNQNNSAGQTAAQSQPSHVGINEKPPATPGNVPSAYKRGWIARIYDISAVNDLYKYTPEDEIGFFLAKSSNYTLGDYVNELGEFDIFPYWRGEAFINVEKEGKYIFLLDLQTDYCYGIILVEGKKIAETTPGNGQKQTLNGAIALSPGVYRVTFGLSGGISNGIAHSKGQANRFPFKFSVKRPTDAAPVPAMEVLLVAQ